jgi:hypothetical protein
MDKPVTKALNGTAFKLMSVEDVETNGNYLFVIVMWPNCPDLNKTAILYSEK